MQVLLITPPLVQPNSPYPATPYLTAFLRKKGIRTVQADASLELSLELFSPRGLRAAAEELARLPRSVLRQMPESVRVFFRRHEDYVRTIAPTMRFLQDRQATLARRILSRQWLPEGPRFQVLEASGAALSSRTLTEADMARHLASLYLDDIADAFRDGIDPHFAFSRYAETLAVAAPAFDPLLDELRAPPTLTVRALQRICRRLLVAHRPNLIGITVPFPGCLYGALRMGATFKRINPAVQIVIGGGYVSTELRTLSDPRVFDFCDYVVLDDGEWPLLRLVQHVEGRSHVNHLRRTFHRQGGQVIWSGDNPASPGVPIVTPAFDGLPLSRYFSMLEMPNPMARLWSDDHWNKLLLARGCYWHRCAFCDLSLQHICRYRPLPAPRIVDAIESVVRETGWDGFHFADEACEPALLLRVAGELLRRKLRVRWWGNIRFETSFTSRAIDVLRASGCIAVCGGMETADNRTLRLMKKGITVESAARVARMFSDAGILVHAYLMYGFPTETLQETVDALESVRQMFLQGCFQSAFWHRFALTAHSPMARAPTRYGIRLLPFPQGGFAMNEIPFASRRGCRPDTLDMLGKGLRYAVYNYMYGIGLDADVREWFPAHVPAARVSGSRIADCAG